MFKGLTLLVVLLLTSLGARAENWPGEQWDAGPPLAGPALKALEDYAFAPRDDATREGMMRKEAAQRSPRFEDKKFDVFYNAPLVLFLSADPAWRYSMLDCGIAVQNIALAAESMGLGSVILGLPREAFKGERADEFRRRLCFLPGEDFAIAIAIGVPADTKAAHPVHDGHISYID